MEKITQEKTFEIINLPKVVFSRWYTHFAQVFDIIKTGRHIKYISNLIIVKFSPLTDN